MAVPAVKKFDGIRLSFGVLERARNLARNYVIRTILQAVVTILAVITFTFFLVRLMPGNPVQVYIDLLISKENISYDEAHAKAWPTARGTARPSRFWLPLDLRLRAPGLYKSACGNETMTRRD